MSDAKREWPCKTCRYLGPEDTTGTHTCDRPWPELSRAQLWRVSDRLRSPVWIGTPKQIAGETPNDPIVCDTYEKAP